LRNKNVRFSYKDVLKKVKVILPRSLSAEKIRKEADITHDFLQIFFLGFCTDLEGIAALIRHCIKGYSDGFDSVSPHFLHARFQGSITDFSRLPTAF